MSNIGITNNHPWPFDSIYLKVGQKTNWKNINIAKAMAIETKALIVLFITKYKEIILE